MPQVAQLMEWIRQNTRFVFNSFVIWDKGDFRALAWKNPSADNNLRSWFNICEYCLFYTFQDETGLTTVMLDTNNFPTLRGYFKDFQDALGLTKKQIIDKVGQQTDHCFRWGSSQWDMPTPETYQQLIDIFGINKWCGFREYEDLRREYEGLRREYEDLRYVHNLDPAHNNVWRSGERNSGTIHPTQKPLDLFERIINTSSRPGAVVLDPFIGSGTTGVACINTGRNYIGFEKDAGYFAVAEKRIQKHKAQIKLPLEGIC